MAKGYALSTGYLPRGGLPRNSVDRITDRPDMTSADDRGRKASTQTNKKYVISDKNILFTVCSNHILAFSLYTGGLLIFQNFYYINHCNVIFCTS